MNLDRGPRKGTERGSSPPNQTAQDRKLRSETSFF